MISNFKKPNLNAPRYREKVFSILNIETLKEFKEKYPAYKNIDNDKLKNIIKFFNEKIWQEVIQNRDGVELPYSLGYLFIGTCPAAKSVNTDYALSKNMERFCKTKTGILMVKLQKFSILTIQLSIDLGIENFGNLQL